MNKEIMDKNNSDTPGDCRIVTKADSSSTTKTVKTAKMTPTITTREGLRRHQQNQQQQQHTQPLVEAQQQQQQQQVSSTTSAGIATKSKSPTPPLLNKLKSQQQPQQHYQFRTPQQFVKHKHASSISTVGCVAAGALKKQKTWSKRQHNKMCKQNLLVAAGSSNNAVVGGNVGQVLLMAHGTTAATTTNKADLENIQNNKNQIAGAAGGGGGGTSGTNVGSTSSSSVINHNLATTAAAIIGLEKLGHCHGHLKPQTYKKMLSHGGRVALHHHQQHHHHVLCAGAAHNSHGNNATHHTSCCLVNGCNGVNGGAGGAAADKDSNAGSISGSVGSAAACAHYCCGRSKFFLPDKRPRKDVFVPPTKFLLGGNISDPLNLNSLQNETGTSSNANSNNNTPGTTPRQSPITTPPKVEVIIPPNIHDPLHLLDPVDSMEYEKQLTSPMKRGGVVGGALQRIGGHLKATHKHRNRKNRKRRSRHDSETSIATTTSGVGSVGGNEQLSLLALAPTSNITAAVASDLVSGEILGASTLAKDQQQTPHKNLLNISGGGVESCIPKVLIAEVAPLAVLTAAVAAAAATTATSNVVAASLDNISKQNVEEMQIDKAVERLDDEIIEKKFTPEVLTTATTLTVQQQATTTATTNSNNVLAAKQKQQPEAVATSLATTSAATTRRNDLHLDLSMSGISFYGLNSSNGAIGSGGGGRKRKISESNNSQKNKKFHRHDAMDKIVSPVVPQPGAWKRPPRLQPTGARKSNTRRSTSFSESSELLPSPVDEIKLPTSELETKREDTPDTTNDVANSTLIETTVAAVAATADICLGSPLSTVSGGTSINAGGEQDSLTMDTSALVVAEVKSEDVDDLEAKKLPTATTTTLATLTKMPKFRADGIKYRYGNFDRYADFRQLNEFRDVRLQVFQRHLELFQNKDILDIGCNVGHMTITVAKHLAPKSILGIDIDRELVARARRNLSMFVRIPSEMPVESKKQSAVAVKKETEVGKYTNVHKKGRRSRKRKRNPTGNAETPHIHMHHMHHHHHHHILTHFEEQQQRKLQELQVDAQEFFPISFPLIYGGIPNANDVLMSTQAGATKTPGSASVAQVTSTSSTTPGANNSSVSMCSSSGTTSSKRKNNFPQNVYFRNLNYVLKDEALMSQDTQQYDLILCLSVTKWIHLNFGDAGLKLAFKRMFNQLRPGGKLILEAQNWASYKKKRNLTPEIYKNYKQIEFFPNKFHEYLLSSEVGFSHSYTLGVPRHMNKGFCRPIQLYAKGDYTPNHVRWSDAYYPQTPYEAYRGIYATITPRILGSGGGGGLSGAASTRGSGSNSGSLPFHLGSARSQNYDTPHYTGSAGGGGGGSGSYSCRQTPMHQPTSQYYNPLETDSYQPSYDIEALNHMYVFASPLYQTVWSPPASLRKSSSHTPVFGSVREADVDGGDGSGGSGGGSYHRHVYPPNDDTCSPNANAGYAFSSIRDPDTDDSNQLPGVEQRHVYATNCGESSSSPQVNHHDSETIEALLLDDAGGSSTPTTAEQTSTGGTAGSNYCDLNDA